MQFEVPQFIEIEDKIFGPLTWRQFLYLGGGIGMAVVLFIVFNFFIALILAIPLAALAGALAFYPINNRPFSFFIEAIYNYIISTRLYLWRQQRETVYQHRFAPNTKPDHPLPHPTAQQQPLSKNIASLARRLELEALKKEM